MLSVFPGLVKAPDVARKVIGAVTGKSQISPVTFCIASLCDDPAPRPPPVQARKGGGYHKNSSTEAKIQNDGNHNVDRTVFLGGRNDT